jgi:hypothetical protein
MAVLSGSQGIVEDIYTSPFNMQSARQSSRLQCSQILCSGYPWFLLFECPRATLHECLVSWFQNTVRQYVSLLVFGAGMDTTKADGALDRCSQGT